MSEDGPRGRAGTRFLLFAILAALVLWLPRLDTPFARVEGFADWISSQNGRIAKNHLRYGLAATRGDQIRNLEPAPPEEWIHYNNHPGTLDLLTAGVFAVLGSDAPWAHRLLPLLATLATVALLWVLAARTGLDPGVCAGLWLLAPLTLTHGLDLSYEPLCIAVMVALLLGWQAGRRWSLLPFLVLGGLVDYPVLYLAPFFGLCALGERRHAAWPYVAALAGSALLSFGIHLAHVAWAMGGLETSAGVSWWDHVLLSLGDRAPLPGLLAWLWSQLVSLHASFGVPLLALGALGLVLLLQARPRRRAADPEAQAGSATGPGFPGALPILAFGFAGVLHVALFRAHAVVHDFWLAYLGPSVAGLAAVGVARLPRGAGIGALVVAAGLGLWQGNKVWAEREAIPVRAVAADLEGQFGPETVLHMLNGLTPGPPGWALGEERGALVLDAADLVYQPFATYLDRLGSLAALGRPQRLVVLEAALRPTDLSFLEEHLLPFAEARTFDGRAGRWRVYDLGPLLLDPGLSPYLTTEAEPRLRLDAAARARLIARAHELLALGVVPAGSSLTFLDGGSRDWERIRGRRVRSGGEAELAAGEGSFAAWAGGPWAARLAARFPGRSREVEVPGPTGPVTLRVLVD